MVKIGAAVSGFKKVRGSTYVYPPGRKVTAKGAVTPNHRYSRARRPWAR